MSLYLVMRLRVTLRFVAVSSTIMIRNFRSCEADIINNAKKVKKNVENTTNTTLLLIYKHLQPYICVIIAYPSRIE